MTLLVLYTSLHSLLLFFQVRRSVIGPTLSVEMIDVFAAVQVLTLQVGFLLRNNALLSVLVCALVHWLDGACLFTVPLAGFIKLCRGVPTPECTANANFNTPRQVKGSVFKRYDSTGASRVHIFLSTNNAQ